METNQTPFVKGANVRLIGNIHPVFSNDDSIYHGVKFVIRDIAKNGTCQLVVAVSGETLWISADSIERYFMPWVEGEVWDVGKRKWVVLDDIKPDQEVVDEITDFLDLAVFPKGWQGPFHIFGWGRSFAVTSYGDNSTSIIDDLTLEEAAFLTKLLNKNWFDHQTGKV